MSKLTPQAQALVTAFEAQPGVTHDHAANLQKVLQGSPALVDQINAAVAAGHLRHIAPLPAGTNAGGQYNGGSQTMELPLSMLATPAGGAFRTGEPTFVLGHELQHGFNNAASVQAYAKFDTMVAAETAKTVPVHDYTQAVGQLIASNRRDEAGAEVAGWNAIVSSATQANPHATLRDIYAVSPFRMADFIDRTPDGKGGFSYAMKPNLAVNADHTMAATPANLEGMGQNYFDKPPNASRLGALGTSDYANYYGAYAISVAIESERSVPHPAPGTAPELRLDLQRLHLSERVLEENGINLGTGHTPQPYVDTSGGKHVLHHFDHTATTHTFVPIAAGEAREAGGSSPGVPAMGAAATGNAPVVAAQDRALYAQIRHGVEGVDAQLGRRWDAQSEAMTHGLLHLAKANGLDRVDLVALSQGNGRNAPGEQVFLVRGDPNDPAHQRVAMPTADALKAPPLQPAAAPEREAPAQALPIAAVAPEPEHHRRPMSQ